LPFGGVGNSGIGNYHGNLNGFELVSNLNLFIITKNRKIFI
jgi:acyl-CoA reductase-like NAD-dependent aldehyde dehydrogenase